MRILYDARRPVKSSRPFGEGIAPPDPAWLTEMSDADRPTAAGRPWEREVRAMLRSLGYPPCNVNVAVCWVVGHGQLDTCPVVDREDWGPVNAIVARMTDEAPRAAWE